MKISIILPILMTKQYHVNMTMACINNIKAFARDDYELIVVQSLSKFRSEYIARILEPTDKHLMFEGNMSQPKSMNLAIKQSTGEYICLMSNDVFIHSYDWTDQLVDDLNNSGYGFIGLMVDRMKLSKYLEFQTGGEIYNYIHPSSFTYIALQGTTFSRKTFDKIGEFDEELPFHKWDIDYMQRSKDNGFKSGVDTRVLATSLLNMTYCDAGPLPNGVDNYWTGEAGAKETEVLLKKYGRIPS